MIATIATRLGEAIGLSPAEVERIRTASLLHDLGKLAISDEILHKPGGLDASEWRTVTEHPRIGQLILEQAGALRDAADIVLHHHEWFDGRGYPYGLAGGEIPIGARIVTIADAYEAMVAGRPYQDPMSHEAALRELRPCSGSQFDPELVEVFLSLYQDRAPRVAVAPDLSGDAGTGGPGMREFSADTQVGSAGTGSDADVSVALAVDSSRGLKAAVRPSRGGGRATRRSRTGTEG